MRKSIFLNLVFWCSICCVHFASAVELDEQSFEDVKQDISRLYSSHSYDGLKHLRWNAYETYLELSTPIASQGKMHIKLPIKKQNVVILQAPHRFFDLHTGDIAEDWFQRDDVDVLMFNTTQRYENDKSDLSRLEKSLFTATVAALMELQVTGTVVQVHGFSSNKRKTTSAQHADFILSNGLNVPYMDFVTTQSCIRDSGQLLARIYGRDVFELGATLNPVGRLINRTKNATLRFLHIEMPREIRVSMKNRDISNEVVTCLLQR